MRPELGLLIAAIAFGTAGMAAAKPQPSFTPSTLPVAQDAESDLATPAIPPAPMSQPVAPPAGLSPEAMIDSLAAIKGSPDGSQTAVDVPRRVKRMLMNPQRGKIGGGGGDDKNKKKGDLKKIGNTAEFPYSTIGVLASGCTGTVVMKRFVLTAAWCVFDVNTKKFFQNLNFYPGMSGKKTPFGEVAWKNAWVAKGFSEKGDLAFGYGLVELDKDIGDTTGWFGFGDAGRFSFKQLTMTGYALDGKSPVAMVETRCPIDVAEDNAIFYRCRGDGRALVNMIGAPIWFKGKADDAWQILGIHVTAQNDKLDSWWAARLNAAHTETIVGWANSADQPEEQTGEEDTGEDQVTETDEEETETEVVVETPECTCEEQSQAQ